MKILLFSLLTLCFLQTAICQITGRVTRADKQPLQSANVLLLKAEDSSVAKSTLTDEKGNFMFEGVAIGGYVLRLTSVGYQTITSPLFQLAQNQTNKDFGTLVMREQSQQLAGVVVKAEKPLYQQKAEGLVVNVENSVLTKGSSVLEVLERSPGVVIDHHNNNIALNGKSGVMVMLDGKLLRMSMEQMMALLNSMSADDIASIELLTTPSAKYDAEGTAGIINIVLKKAKKHGTNGSFALTGGYGYAEKASSNISIDHHTGKIDVYGSCSFNHDKSYSHLFGQGYEIVPALGGATDFDFWAINKPGQNNHNARAGIDAKINSKWSVGANINYNNSRVSANSVNRGEYTVLPDSLLIFNGQITGISHSTNIISSVYAERQLGEGEKINVDIDYLHYNVSSPTNVEGSFVNKNGQAADAASDSLFSPSQRAYGTALIQVGVAKMDYTKQLGKKVKLETGIKGTYTVNSSISGIESLINGEWVSPVETVNNIVMKEGIAAAYASTTTQISPSTNLVTGARYEYYSTHANDAKTGATTLSRKLGQLFPSIFLTKKLDDNSDIQLSDTKRITRPTYNDLASYISYNDPLSVFTGNPLLKPTVTNNIKLGYNYRNYTFSLLFSRDDYPIAQGQITESPSGEIVYIAPQNVTYQNNITVQTNVPVKINNWWNMAYGIVGGWRQFMLDYTLQPAIKSYFAYSLNFDQVFKLPGNISAEISGWYNTASYYGSAKVDGIWALNAGIKKDLKNNKGILQLAVTDLLRSTNYNNHIGAVTKEAFATTADIRWSAESTMFPIIKLTYSRTFGNNKTKTEKHDNEGLEEKGRIK